jgi:type 1 glutamine amidotransferase
MTQNLNRRDLLKTAGALALGAAAGSFPMQWVRGEDAKPKKVLFFTRSQGFQHDVVKRKSADELSFAETMLSDFGKKHGFEVTASKDGTLFTEEGLKPFDAIVFYTTGDLEKHWIAGNMEAEGVSKPMPPDGKKALIKFVADGKGFLGMHCATDTWDHHGDGAKTDPYIRMLGGEFVIHGAQQNAQIKVVDPKFIAGLTDFEKTEEWYRLKNFAPDLHVILVQETDSMKEDQYKKDGAYPETWARKHEKGRVFYTSMGHREDVWKSDIFENVVMGGLAWVVGNVDADVTPNLEQAAPAAMNRLAKPPENA